MRRLAAETVKKVGQEVLLQGWVDARRDHGKIIFFDLRDRSGIVQLVLAPSVSTLFTPGVNQVDTPGLEDVIEVVGLVKERPANMVNPKIPTGTVEVEIKALTIISKARELPFPIDSDGYDINEEIRSRYRYIDIRRPRMSRNLRLHSKMTMFIRNFLIARDFASTAMTSRNKQLL